MSSFKVTKVASKDLELNDGRAVLSLETDNDETIELDLRLELLGNIVGNLEMLYVSAAQKAIQGGEPEKTGYWEKWVSWPVEEVSVMNSPMDQAVATVFHKAEKYAVSWCIRSELARHLAELLVEHADKAEKLGAAPAN